MNVSFEKVDKVNALLTIQIEKADYEKKVATALKDFRKKASLPGFRPGMVPVALLKKRFGIEILTEQVNKILGEEVNKYIHEQKINILGEPLPNEEKQEPIDFETQENFTFIYDLALTPEFDATLSEKDTLDYYQIEVTDEMVNRQVENYAQRGGQYNKVDEYKDGDMVKGILAQLDAEGNVLEGGIQVEGAVMLPNYMKNDDEKAKFNGSKVNDVLVFNPAKAYENSNVEISSLLKISKEEAAEMKADFSYQITEMTRHEASAINQELFDKILGEGVVSSEEEFRAYIKKQMEDQFVIDSEYKLVLDLRTYLTERVGKLEFPEATLKRYMTLANQDKDAEFIEKTFAPSLEDLKWHLIKGQLSEQFDIDVNQEDVLKTAKIATRIQFAQYGMMNIPEEVLMNYAQEMLKNKQQVDTMVARTIENKIAEKAMEVVTLNRKTISLDEFNNMFAQEDSAE